MASAGLSPFGHVREPANKIRAGELYWTEWHVQLKIVWQRYKLISFWSFSFLCAPYESWNVVRQQIIQWRNRTENALENQQSNDKLASTWQGQGTRPDSTNTKDKTLSNRRTKYIHTSRQASYGPLEIEDTPPSLVDCHSGGTARLTCIVCRTTSSLVRGPWLRTLKKERSEWFETEWEWSEDVLCGRG
jgi:hypothetical protein